MSDTVVLSIRVPAKTKAKLEKLAELSGRSKAWHAAEALEEYATREIPIVKGIREAMEQGRRGEVMTMEEAFARTRKIIATAKAKQAAKRK
ncbi:MAG: ribbon-helix-helix protein, CopG family [Terricaulis sp.]